MRIIAFDVETPNYRNDRMSAIGVAVVERGQFGADMKVELVNDGPFTLMLDTQELFGK